VQIDDHIWVAYSGLTADGRILANKARIECQSYRLNYDDAPPVVMVPFTQEYIAKYIGETKQKYTQKGGVRPFGLAALIVGFDIKGLPHLYATDPSGMLHWQLRLVLGVESQLDRPQ
jgi:20S proteasome subunit alpha 4